MEGYSVRQLLKYAVVSAGAGLYIKDCHHVLSVLLEHRAELSADGQAEFSKNTRKLLDAYKDKDPSAPCDKAEQSISGKEFKERLSSLIAQIAEGDPSIGLASLDLAKFYEINRESAVFLGGGRAALLQLAHPYVAAGVAQHSNIKTVGVQQRFYNTFSNMFALVFEDSDKVSASAKRVRKLHDSVRGRIEEDVGIFKKDSTFAANNSHALFWVSATLIEGAVFMYEMYVRKLTTEEKDKLIRQSVPLGGAFGLGSEHYSNTWAEFMAKFKEALNSDLIAVSKDAKMIDEFLWEPPKARLGPLLRLVRWSTAVKMPNRLRTSFYHREINRLDLVLWTLLTGFVRFVYRFLPPSVRWLTPYWKARERCGNKLTFPQRLLVRGSAKIATAGLAEIMPPKE